MGTKSLNYQYLSKNFVIMPFMVILSICFSAYLVSDMTSTINTSASYVQKINHLLSQSASIPTKEKRRELITAQVSYLSKSSPEIESINFFPTSTQEKNINTKLTLTNMLFGNYHTLNEPVIISEGGRQTFIGYTHITLNLTNMRKRWFADNLPMFLVVIISSIASLLIMLQILKKRTKRLPMLEELSKKVLKNEEIDEKAYQQENDKQAVWLYEKAIFHLLNTQKTHQYNLIKLSHDLNKNKESLEKQIEQYSNFQSNLTHELKLSINHIESGLKLLKSQYVSNEQQESVDMIDTGIDDLNDQLNQLVWLNRIEKGQLAISTNHFEPTQLLNSIIEKFQHTAQKKDILLLAKSYHSDYVLEGDMQKIEIIVASLVDNALRFTDSGQVTISSYIQHLENNLRWTIKVKDTGIGIDKNQIPHIFQPFYQVNPDDKHNHHDMSFGLFLTKKIAELINADIEVESQLDKGSTFSLHIVLKDWNNRTEQQVFQDKKIAIWYKNEDAVKQMQRLVNIGADIQRFKDRELLTDYLTKNQVDMLVISFKIPYKDVLNLTTKLREHEETTHFRTLIVYYYQPKYLSPEQQERLQGAGVDYLENIYLEYNLNQQIEKLIEYLS